MQLPWQGGFAPSRVALLQHSALRLAIEIASEGAEDPVVALPAYSCYDVATAAIGAGVKVVLYDIDPSTLGPDWESLEKAMQVEPVALVVAHLFG